MIDWTISIGNMLTVFGFVAGGLLFVFAMRGQMDLFGQRLSTIEKQTLAIEYQISKLSDAMIQVAIEKTRLDGLSHRVNMLDQRLDEVRHGVGLVRDPRQKQ